MAYILLSFVSMRSAPGCGESKRIGKTFRPDSKGGPVFLRSLESKGYSKR